MNHVHIFTKHTVGGCVRCWRDALLCPTCCLCTLCVVALEGKEEAPSQPIVKVLGQEEEAVA